MNNSSLDKAIWAAADVLHDKWREGYKAANGDKPRWKPLNEASVKWVNENGVDVDCLRVNPETQKPEINIAGLPNSKLPPQHSGENTAAARGAIEAIVQNPQSSMENLASIVHDQWLSRNSSWAPAEQKKPYADLSEAEKEKDRVIVRVAQKALNDMVSNQAATALRAENKI